MKKFILSSFVIITFFGYALYKRGLDAVSATNNGTAGNVVSSIPITGQPSTSSAQSNTYKDGEFTGSVADAYYGNIQVAVTINNGAITDVKFLQYPNDRGTSREINGQAMPYLKSEAISAQSSNVDIVSGATDSSLAFMQSMRSALLQATN